jgi:ornithine carbamoyltransferase
MAAHRGMEVVVLRPEGYALPKAVMDKARKAAEASGGSLSETSDRATALQGAQILYAKEWGLTSQYGDEKADQAQRARLRDWCVSEAWFETTAADARLMHCLPVRRNTAVTDAVMDSSRSVVQQQAYNRLTAQMAVLYRLFHP